MAGLYATELPDDVETDERMRQAMRLLQEREPELVASRAPGLMGKAAAGLRDMTTLATPAVAAAEMLKGRYAAGGPETIADPAKFSGDVAAKLRRAVEDTGRVPVDIAEHGKKLVAGLPDASPSAATSPSPSPSDKGRMRVGMASHVEQPRTAVLGEAAVPAEIPEIGEDPRKSAPDSLHPAIRALLGHASGAAADPGLERAQRSASDSRLMAALTRAGGAAIGRGTGQGYDALDAAAEVPIRDYQQRKAERDARSKAAIDAEERTRRRGREDLQMSALQREEDQARLEADPASAESSVARDLLAKMVPELAARPELKNATAAQIKRQFPFAKEILDDQLRRMQMAAGADERRLRREEMRERQEAATAAKKQEKVDRDVKELAEDVGKMGAPNFYSQAGEAQGIIEANPKDLPGFGTFGGRTPDFLTSGEGIALRQSIGQMLAEYRKGVTGAGMSDAERSEYGSITGLLQSGNEDSVRQGVGRLKRAMDERVRARAAGSIPEAAAEYGRRVPAVGQALSGGKPGGGWTPEKQSRLDELRKKRTEGALR